MLLLLWKTIKLKYAFGWAITDPHFRSIIDKPNQKNGKENQKKESWYTPCFPIAKKENNNAEKRSQFYKNKKDIFNLISECDYFVNARIFESNNNKKTLQQQWIGGIYIVLGTEYKTKIGYDIHNNHHNHFWWNNEKIQYQNKTKGIYLDQAGNVKIEFDFTKGNLIISYIMVKFTIKKGYHKQTNTTYLDFQFHTDPGWYSNTIEGILGATGNRNYQNCSFYFPGNVKDYQIKEAMFSYTSYYGFQHVFNRYMNCFGSLFNNNNKICDRYDNNKLSKQKQITKSNENIMFQPIFIDNVFL